MAAAIVPHFSKKRTYSSVKDPPKLSMRLIGQDRKSTAETPSVPVVAKNAACSADYNGKHQPIFAAT
ncbi:MAG TPA: hypothetical protein VMF69_00250 [Gemmataceae bacterium]|nr:hypothetical protein [Gemmataceae bacterium]